MSDKKILILRTTDILSTNTNATYYGTTQETNSGIISNNRDNMTWKNVNMRQVLGTLYDKYERFNISLVQATVGVAEDAWLASALQNTQAVEGIRNLVIKMGGMPFDAPIWSQKKGQTQLAPMGTILLNRLHDSEIIKGCGKATQQIYPAESCRYTFTKNCDNVNINIQLHNVQSDTYPVYDLYGAPTAPRLHGHCVFVFSIEGVTKDTPERRVLKLSTSDITSKNNTLDYVTANDGLLDANQYGTISRSKMTTTWNNINIRTTFGDEFYRRYKKYKINLNTAFITPQDSATNSIDINTTQYSVYPLTNPAQLISTNSFSSVACDVNKMKNTTWSEFAFAENVSPLLPQGSNDQGFGDFPDPYFYPVDGKIRTWKQLAYLNGGTGVTSSYNLQNFQWNDFIDGTTVKYKGIQSIVPAGHQYNYQIYPISFESPTQVEAFFTVCPSNTDRTSVKLGRLYGDPVINGSYSYSTNATPTFATGFWRLWFVDTANQYVGFVNGDSTSANRSVYIYDNYNLTGTPIIVNLAGSNNVGLRRVSFEFRKPYGIVAPKESTSDGKAFLMTYNGNGTMSYTITDAFKSSWSGSETLVTDMGQMNATLVKTSGGWKIAYIFSSATYITATTTNIEYKYAVWDGVQDSVPFYRMTYGYQVANNSGTPAKQVIQLITIGLSEAEGEYLISYYAMRHNVQRDCDFDLQRAYNYQATTKTYVSGGAIGTNTVTLNSTQTVSNYQTITGLGLPIGTYIRSVAGSTYTLSANFTEQASGTYYIGNALSINTTQFDNGQIDSYSRVNNMAQSPNMYMRCKSVTGFSVTEFVAQIFNGTVAVSSSIFPSENRDLSICLDGLAYSAPTYSTPQFISGSTALMRTMALPNYPDNLTFAGINGQQNNIYDKPISYTFQKWNENIPMTINLYDITDANGIAGLYGTAYSPYDRYCSKPGDQYYLFDVEGVEEEEN